MYIRIKVRTYVYTFVFFCYQIKRLNSKHTDNYIFIANKPNKNFGKQKIQINQQNYEYLSPDLKAVEIT